MNRRTLVGIFAAILAPLLLMAQTSGPTIQTPRLTVGTGTGATAGNLRVNGNVTITGTCTGCGSSEPFGAFTLVSLSFENACSSTPNVSMRAQRSPNGRLVHIQFTTASVSCTSDSADFMDQDNSISASFLPTESSVCFMLPVTDNAVAQPGAFCLRPDGTAEVQRIDGQGTWTTSNTKAVSFGGRGYTFHRCPIADNC